jgi:hypothetical protein
MIDSRRYQHVIPQREQDHEVRPQRHRVDGPDRIVMRCWTCDKPIKRVTLAERLGA